MSEELEINDDSEMMIQDHVAFANMIRCQVVVSLSGRLKNTDSESSRTLLEVLNNTDLDQLATVSQCVEIIKDKGENIYEGTIITPLLFQEIFNDIQELVMSSGLAKASANGSLDCYWDDEKQDMVFWKA